MSGNSFPGPLEGIGESTISLPSDLSEAIKTQLSSHEVEPSSFWALINSANIYRIELNHAELASETLKAGSYRLSNVKDRTQLTSILFGLASVAAVTRSSSLAKDLRILVRIYRNDTHYELSIDEEIRLCLIAAASYENLDYWKEFVGDWVTELAFGKLEETEGLKLISHLECLCFIVPELWITCSRAIAALKSFNSN